MHPDLEPTLDVALELTDTGITVQDWTTLFSDNDSSTEWFRVQSAESKQAGSSVRYSATGR